MLSSDHVQIFNKFTPLDSTSGAIEAALEPESLVSFIVLIARLTRHIVSRSSQFNRRFLGTQAVISGAYNVGSFFYEVGYLPHTESLLR